MAALQAFVPRTYADYQKYNFFRTPDWRWDRVLKLADRPGSVPGRCTKRDDDVVRAARAFYLKRQSTAPAVVDRLLFENPGLCYAYDFYLRTQEVPDAALYIQARLLARQTPEQIAAVTGMLPDAVAWYADLFFDVIPYLDQRDWVTNQIIVPALTRAATAAGADAGPAAGFRDSTVARPFLDGSLKLFAYFGGPHLVDLMIGGVQAGKPLTSPEDADNWLDKTIGTSIRRRTAQAAQLFEINKYNVMELFAVHTRIMEIDKSSENQDQARSTLERHIKSMVDDIPWAVGDDGSKLYGGTAVGRFDEMAPELRDDELLQIASGRTTETVARDNFPAALPPPRKEKKSVLMAQEPEL